MANDMALTVTVLQRVIDRVADGCTVTTAAKSLGISRSGVYVMLQRHPEMQDDFDRARKMAAHSVAEDVLEIADGIDDPKSKRVRCDARKWLASKLDPKTYGDKLDLNVTQQVDVRGALSEARARLRPVSDQQNIIDAEVVEVKQVDRSSTADCESVDPLTLDIFK